MTIDHGNLIITKDNQDQFRELTKVIGWLYIREGASLTAPKLTRIGALEIYKGASLTAPKLTEVTCWLYIREGASLTAPKLSVIPGGEDSRGYYFNGWRKGKSWIIGAGCQSFSLSDARKHWGPGGASDRPDCFALVEKIAAEIARRTLANSPKKQPRATPRS